MLKVTIKSDIMEPEFHSFTVPEETTVLQLKKKMMEKIYLPVEMQVFVLSSDFILGEELKNDRKLTDYIGISAEPIFLVDIPFNSALDSVDPENESSFREQHLKFFQLYMGSKYSKFLDQGIESTDVNLNLTSIASSSKTEKEQECIPNSVEGTANVTGSANAFINTPEIPPKEGQFALQPRKIEYQQIGAPLTELFKRLSLGGSYVEGNSVLSDCFMGLARVITLCDMNWLISVLPCDVEGVVVGLRPRLQAIVTTHLLKGKAPTEENVAKACQQIRWEMKIYLDLMHKAKLVESIDAIATVENYNKAQLPRLITPIIDRSTNDIDFAKTMIRCVSDYFGKLCAIIIHCCLDGRKGLETFVRNILRLFTNDIYVQQNLEYNVICGPWFNLRSYAAKLNVPLEDIEVYIVRRLVGKETSKRSQELMEIVASPSGDARAPLENQLFSENECLSTDRDAQYRLPAKRRK